MTTLMNGAFKAQILASAGKGATLGTITVTRSDPARFAGASTGLVMTLPISEQGVSLKAVITAVYYVKGKFGQEIDFNSYGPAFPTCNRQVPDRHGASTGSEQEDPAAGT